MCVSPLTISFKGETRKLREACGLPTSILVPCGTCSECAKKKATSWGIRAYREFLFAPANSVRFVTVTLDEGKGSGAREDIVKLISGVLSTIGSFVSL